MRVFRIRFNRRENPNAGKRNEIISLDRVRLLQLKLYLIAKWDLESLRKSRLHGQQAFDMLVKDYGLIKPYAASAFRPVNACR